MKQAIKKGLGFGLTSGIITTLGLIIGLAASTSSKNVVISGILIIALADSLSDALGIHISEEADSKKSKEHIWKSTIATLLSKIIFALSFIIPVLLFSLTTALIISIIWGLLLICLFTYYITKSIKAIFEHLGIAILVIILTYFIGSLINN